MSLALDFYGLDEMTPSERQRFWKRTAEYADRIGRERYGRKAWEAMASRVKVTVTRKGEKP